MTALPTIWPSSYLATIWLMKMGCGYHRVFLMLFSATDCIASSVPPGNTVLSTVLYTTGKLDAVIPLTQQIGFDALYIAQPELNDLAAVQRAGQGNLSFMGAVPASLVMHGTEQSIKQQVTDTIALLASDTGYSAGVGLAAEMNGSIPVKNFFSFLRALPPAKN